MELRLWPIAVYRLWPWHVEFKIQKHSDRVPASKNPRLQGVGFQALQFILIRNP